MLTNPDELRRRAQEHSAEDLEFRRHVRDHHISDHPLRERVAELLGGIDCRECANCCRETRVPINEAEIRAIAAELKMTPWEARRLYTETGEEAGEILIKQASDQCVFLDSGQCLVYGARPEPCRQFPAITLHADVLGNRMSSVCRQASICPVVYEALEEFKHTTGFHPRKRHA
ncbi:MAG TPA: YkgJ family cysteine cluster protein [Bryobacteraceae bacterium]|nr:YkgJ family cysteine cluster protein [Bryobacteraceae bacterium]HPT26037.1 YkgJ family cysteine cluster protein [Bryobacteraceae bacterium]